jgi:serine O-acetyltransferase
VGAGTVIAPFVTIGLVEGGMEGPTIGANVNVGTGACILGTVTVGDGAGIGAGAVVLDDVPAGATAVGVPARVLDSGPPVSDI